MYEEASLMMPIWLSCLLGVVIFFWYVSKMCVWAWKHYVNLEPVPNGFQNFDGNTPLSIPIDKKLLNPFTLQDPALVFLVAMFAMSALVMGLLIGGAHAIFQLLLAVIVAVTVIFARLRKRNLKIQQAENILNG